MTNPKVPGLHGFQLGSTVPCNPLLCPPGPRSAKGLRDFVPALAKMLAGIAEPC